MFSKRVCMKQSKETPINREAIISFLGKNKDFLKKEFSVNKIALFGSYARGEARKDSDIDIIVDMGEADFMKLIDLQEFLEKRFQKKVDVVTFNGVRTFVKRQIDKDIIYA